MCPLLFGKRFLEFERFFVKILGTLSHFLAMCSTFLIYKCSIEYVIIKIQSAPLHFPN